jgi:hypothetical protein
MLWVSAPEQPSQYELQASFYEVQDDANISWELTVGMSKALAIKSVKHLEILLGVILKSINFLISWRRYFFKVCVSDETADVADVADVVYVNM